MVRESTPLHVWIRQLVKSRPYSRSELMKKLKNKCIRITPGRLDGTLKRMKDWEEVKTLSDGRYADKDYRIYEVEIIETVKKIYEERKLPKFYNKNLKKSVAFRIHANINDKEFLASFDNAMKKLNMVPIPE